MKQILTILQYEFKHFSRNSFKVLALVLFIGAAVYGLQNGYTLLQKQQAEIAKIKEKNAESIAEVTSWFDAGKKGPDDKPWIDITTPSRAIALSPATIFKEPSVLLTFSIGQAEQFGYYKSVSNFSSVFDADLAEELANPERLMGGTLDFSFAGLYLLPLLAVIFLFNVGGLEKDRDFERMIRVSQPSYSTWLLARFGFYFALLSITVLLLLLVYGFIVGAFQDSFAGFIQVFLIIELYILVWMGAFYLINLTGSGSAGQAIKMASLWLLFCVVIPGAVHQYMILKYPANYMTDYLDATREETYKVYDLPAAVLKEKVLSNYPVLANTKVAKDTIINARIMSSSISGITNDLMKGASAKVEKDNELKNRVVKSLSIVNPVSWFQNTINAICETDYYSYYRYRSDIQSLIDTKVEVLLKENWDQRTVTRERFMEYVSKFKGYQNN